VPLCLVRASEAFVQCVAPMFRFCPVTSAASLRRKYRALIVCGLGALELLGFMDDLR
jgi:hypothetical protein